MVEMGQRLRAEYAEHKQPGDLKSAEAIDHILSALKDLSTDRDEAQALIGASISMRELANECGRAQMSTTGWPSALTSLTGLIHLRRWGLSLRPGGMRTAANTLTGASAVPSWGRAAAAPSMMSARTHAACTSP